MRGGSGNGSSWRRAPLMVALMVMVALLALGAQPRGTFAQGTPGASPTTGPCEAPALPDGTPEPVVEATEAVAEETVAAEETVVAEETAVDDAAATPEEVVVEEGTEADTETQEAVVTAVQNFVNCRNERNFEAVVTLSTPNYLLAETGFENRYSALADYEEWADMASTWTLETAENVLTEADGRNSVEVTYRSGDHELNVERWFFVEEDGTQLIDEEELLVPEVEGDTVVVGLTIDPTTDPYFAWGQTSLVQLPVVTVHIVNNDTAGRSVVIYRLNEEGDAAAAAATPVTEELALAEDAEFIGAQFVAAGEQEDITLVDLEVGTFVAFDGDLRDVFATITIAEPAE